MEPWHFAQGRRHRKQFAPELMNACSKSLGVDWLWFKTLKNGGLMKCSFDLNVLPFSPVKPKSWSDK